MQKLLPNIGKLCDIQQYVEEGLNKAKDNLKGDLFGFIQKTTKLMEYAEVFQKDDRNLEERLRLVIEFVELLPDTLHSWPVAESRGNRQPAKRVVDEL